MPSEYRIRYPKKPPKPYGDERREVTVIDTAHTAGRKQRVYCHYHDNKLVMDYNEERKMYHCLSCGHTIMEGYGQSLIKKKKEEIQYRMITDPYNPDKNRRGSAAIGYPIGRPPLETVDLIQSKDSHTFSSAFEASRDDQEEWY